MEKEPQSTGDQSTSESDEKPPAFEPDPDIVTFLERGAKPDPKEIWRASDREKR